MKKFAFLFIAALCCCFVACMEDDNLLTEESVVEQEIDSRSNSLCISSNPYFPNTNCLTPLPSAVTITSSLTASGMCDVIVVIDASAGAGDYCAFSPSAGILSSGSFGASGTVITFTMDNPSRFIFNIQARNLGPDCYSERISGCP